MLEYCKPKTAGQNLTTIRQNVNPIPERWAFFFQKCDRDLGAVYIKVSIVLCGSLKKIGMLDANRTRNGKRFYFLRFFFRESKLVDSGSLEEEELAVLGLGALKPRLFWVEMVAMA